MKKIVKISGVSDYIEVEEKDIKKFVNFNQIKNLEDYCLVEKPLSEQEIDLLSNYLDEKEYSYDDLKNELNIFFYECEIDNRAFETYNENSYVNCNYITINNEFEINQGNLKDLEYRSCIFDKNYKKIFVDKICDYDNNKEYSKTTDDEFTIVKEV